jgi:hypothetical protein
MPSAIHLRGKHELDDPHAILIDKRCDMPGGIIISSWRLRFSILMGISTKYVERAGNAALRWQSQRPGNAGAIVGIAPGAIGDVAALDLFRRIAHGLRRIVEQGL